MGEGGRDRVVPLMTDDGFCRGRVVGSSFIIDSNRIACIIFYILFLLCHRLHTSVTGSSNCNQIS